MVSLLFQSQQEEHPVEVWEALLHPAQGHIGLHLLRDVQEVRQVLRHLRQGGERSPE